MLLDAFDKVFSKWGNSITSECKVRYMQLFWVTFISF